MARVGGEASRRGTRHMRCDDIPTDTFTPRTYQVELLESALQGNTIACLGSESSKLFLGLMVLRQLAHQVRPTLQQGGKRSIYLVNSEEDVENVWSTLFHHTDLAVGRVTPPSEPDTPSEVPSDAPPSKPDAPTPVTTTQVGESPAPPEVKLHAAGTTTTESGEKIILPGKAQYTAPSEKVADTSGKEPDTQDEVATPEEETEPPQKTSVQRKPVTQDVEELITLNKEVDKPQESNTPLHQGETMTTVEEYGPSSWTAEKWSSFLAENNVLVLTASVFLSCLEKGCLSLDPINLLVLDSCHFAEEDHQYVQIMSFVTQAAPAAPHLLCLTASILGSEVSDPAKLADRIHRLEVTLNSRAETSMLVISERFGCRPKESVIQCSADKDSTGMGAKLAAILLDALYFLEDCKLEDSVPPSKHDPLYVPKFAMSVCLNILQILGPWCAASFAENLISQVEKIVKHESNSTLKLFLKYTLTQLRLVGKVFEKGFTPDYLVEELLQYTTPKVQQLIEILRKYKPDMDFMIITREGENDDDTLSDLSDDDVNDDDDDCFDLSSSDGEDEGSDRSKSKHIHIAVKKKEDSENNSNPFEEEKKLSGVVFVDNRYVAFALNKIVEEVCAWDENLCFVKSSHITGQGVHRADGKKDMSKASRKQEEVLRKFRMQERNLLISTSVLEEGVDIPKCNLVVRFDPPQDYRTYTLTKGRARARDAEYVILVDEELMEDFTEEIQVFKGIEQVLIGAGRGRQDLEDAQQVDHLDNVEFTPLPTFCPLNQPGAPAVSMKTAIGLVNRYCAKLPSDAFTHLTPHCRVCPAPDDCSLFVAYLRLPVNSPIKEELQGTAMPSRQLAKMAVALKMCQLLYKAGELDSHLQPVGKEMFVCEEEEEWEEEEEEGVGQGRPGTTKRKQYYIKKTADAFVSSGPKPLVECYLYSISMALTGPITEDQNTRGRKIYAPEDSMQAFGILLLEPIPHVPSFPVYTRSGEVTVWLDLLRRDQYSTDQLEKLVGFHHFVFSSVLHLEKDPMLFSPESADVGLLIVPLNTVTANRQQLDIEWSFVEQVNQKTVLQKGNAFSGGNKPEIFVFHQEQFEDAVVMPSYRNMDQPQHFYVAEIRHDLSPLSPFPSPELYKTFAAYYTTKYGLTLTSMDQPLLDVDHTSARLNLLTPRYMNQKGRALPTSSLETKRARRENLQQKQILVPELCDIHTFSASLWRKAVCLPAILYRMNYLLLAEELRKQIAAETGIGKVFLDPDFRFPRLDFGFETKPEKLQLPVQGDSDSQIGPMNCGDTTGTASTDTQKGRETSNVDTKKQTWKNGVCTEKRPERLLDMQKDGIDGGEKARENNEAEGNTETVENGHKLKEAGMSVMGADTKDNVSLALVGSTKGLEAVDNSPDEDKTDTGASSDSDSGVALSECEAGGNMEAACVVNETNDANAEHDGTEHQSCHLKASPASGMPTNTSYPPTSQAGSALLSPVTLSTVSTHNGALVSAVDSMSAAQIFKVDSAVGQGDAGSLIKESGQTCQCADTGSSVTNTSVFDSSESSFTESLTSVCLDSEEWEFVTPSSTRSTSPALSISDHSIYEDAVDFVFEDSMLCSAQSPHPQDFSLEFSASVFNHVCDGSLDQDHSRIAIVYPVCSVCEKDSPVEQIHNSDDRERVCCLCQKLMSVSAEGQSCVSGPLSKAVSTSCQTLQVPLDTTDTTECLCTSCLNGAGVCRGVLGASRQVNRAKGCPKTCIEDQECGSPHSQLVDEAEPSTPVCKMPEPITPGGSYTSSTVLIEDCKDPEDPGSSSTEDGLEECDEFLDISGTSSSRKWVPTHTVTMPVGNDPSSFTLPQDQVHITFDHGTHSGLDRDWAHANSNTSGVEWGVGENLTTFEVSGSLAEMSGLDSETAASSVFSGKPSQRSDSAGTSPLSHSDSHSSQSTHTSPHWHGVNSSFSQDSLFPQPQSECAESLLSAHYSLHIAGDSSQAAYSSTSDTTTPCHGPSTSSETHSLTNSGEVSGTRQQAQTDRQAYTCASSSSTELFLTAELVTVLNTKHTSVTYTGKASVSEECLNDEILTENCMLPPCHPSRVPCCVDQSGATDGSGIGVQEQNSPASTVCDSLHSCAYFTLPDMNKSLEPTDGKCNIHSVISPGCEESIVCAQIVDVGNSEQSKDVVEESGWGSEEARPASEWCELLNSSACRQSFALDSQGQEQAEQMQKVDGLREWHSMTAAHTEAHWRDSDLSAGYQHTTHKDSSGVRENQHTTHSSDTHADSDTAQKAKIHSTIERTAEESQAKRNGENPASSPASNADGNGQLDIPEPSSTNSRGGDGPCIFDIGTWNTRKKNKLSEEEISVAGVTEAGSLGLVKLDEDEDLANFVGPSPCLLLQALTMSNANDFFSLERLETIGDSFLKYAITVYLYCTYPATHEGKLSYLRSKQVSNYNLYRLGRRKGLAERMVSTKFEPYENWLPPCYVISEERRRGPVPKVVIATSNPKLSESAPVNFFLEEEEFEPEEEQKETEAFQQELAEIDQQQAQDQQREMSSSHSSRQAAMVPYCLQQHHGIPDKSVADCVEALIGCYLTTCGKQGALIFMSWLGLKVLPRRSRQKQEEGEGKMLVFPELPCPPSPLLSNVPHAPQLLDHLLEGYEEFEARIQYKFRDRSYLLQAFTHASYHYNYITDCYQRLEFLGDAILDYVITRHLYEDSHRYSPGILTDLRSALVNNNIFAALAVKWDFHKFFKAISPSLFIVIDKFVRRQKERMDEIDEIDEDTDEDDEESDDKPEETEGKENMAGDEAGGRGEEGGEEEVELEIPKALGDIFESVAGAIYLDSGMSLDAVWNVYYRMMKPHIDKYLKDIPKSPVRELLEMEPETAKFEKPERTLEGKIRVTVNVVGKGVFYGVGRNYRIAKSAAAKKALRFIRSLQLEGQV